LAIRLKSPAEVEAMAAAGAALAEVFLRLRDGIVQAGMTTADLDRHVEDLILAGGDRPAFKGLYGFPGSACISVNEVVVHGIPGDRRIEDGDIVGVDIGLVRDGWYADSAETFRVGAVRPEVERLCATTQRALDAGVAATRAGNRLSAIGRAIEGEARPNGYGVVETLVGHGIGRALHEDPQVPNVERFHGPDPLLEEGMVLALEPMFNLGSRHVRTLEDEWTIVTVDGAWSAHFEHTVAITENGPRVLTAR
jgi:methionyl aminopeptidase